MASSTRPALKTPDEYQVGPLAEEEWSIDYTIIFGTLGSLRLFKITEEPPAFTEEGPDTTREHSTLVLRLDNRTKYRSNLASKATPTLVLRLQTASNRSFPLNVPSPHHDEQLEKGKSAVGQSFVTSVCGGVCGSKVFDELLALPRSSKDGLTKLKILARKMCGEDTSKICTGCEAFG
jgi:hypothetical protein